jgi:hypothetical protein
MASGVEKDFPGPDQLPFYFNNYRQVTNNYAPVREAWRELTAL